MATYIILIDYTPQGVQSIQDSPARAEEFKATAGRHGVTVRDIFWTFGGHDGVLILECASDKAISRLMLSLARDGNVRTRTLRAYSSDEMKDIVSGLVH